jgi:hypothetical protein
VKFKDFEATARRAWEAIPEEYLQGIDGLTVSREALAHPHLDGIYTLGMCETEAYPSEWVGPDTLRSVVVLYFGSFQKLAAMDPDFDWEAEIFETVEHEVRHHLESLAGQDDLGDVDYAMDEGFKRFEGMDFDPWYYQRGDPLGRGTYAVEDHVFIEQVWKASDFEAAPELRVSWKGREWALDRPDELGDVHFVWLEGVDDAPPALELVLVRDRTWWEEVRRVVGSNRPRVLTSERRARSLG